MLNSKFLTLIVISAAMAGCVSVNSGVLPIGPDTYQISVGRAPIAGGPTEARRAALTQAQSYCAQQKRELMVIGTNVWGDNRGGFDVDFRCLKGGDPGLHRPTLGAVPDVVVKVQ